MPYCSGEKPSVATRYSGRIAETISEETSVSSDQVPSSRTVLPTRLRSLPVAKARRARRRVDVDSTVYICPRPYGLGEGGSLADRSGVDRRPIRSVSRLCPESGLEAVDGRDVERVGRPQDGGIDGAQTPQQQQRREPLHPRRPTSRDPDDRVRARLRDPGRQVAAQRVARMRAGILERDVGEASELASGVPADDLVVVGFGEDGRERRDRGVLVELALPAVRHRARELGARDYGDGSVQRTRERLGLAVLGRVRPPLLRKLLRERGRGLDLVANRRGRGGQRRDLDRRDERVADGCTRLEAGRKRDRGDAVLAGALS